MDLSIQIGRWINKQAEWQAKTNVIYGQTVYIFLLFFFSSEFLFLQYLKSAQKDRHYERNGKQRVNREV